MDWIFNYVRADNGRRGVKCVGGVLVECLKGIWWGMFVG